MSAQLSVIFLAFSLVTVLPGSHQFSVAVDIGFVNASVGLDSVSVRRSFADFKTTFNKAYANAREETLRFQIFADKLAEFAQHNANPAKTWTKGVNFFTDLTEQEIVQQYMGAIPPSDLSANGRNHSYPAITARQSQVPPYSIDWRTRGKVTPVKNQGQCGSCWAFAATGALESALAIKNGGRPLGLSEQYLVDCDTSNGGCRGGWPYRSYDFVKTSTSNSIPPEQVYPYTSGSNGQSTGPCQRGSGSGGGSQVLWYTRSNTGGTGEATLKRMVGLFGPTTVCLDARHLSSYRSGIINDPGCYRVTDHCVLAVGYDQVAGYWILKNSWGSNWGEGGYARVAMGSNMCGVADYGVLPML